MIGFTIHAYINNFITDNIVTVYLLFVFRDRFFRNLILIIVLPLTLAALFIVVVCLKFRPACKSGPEKDEVST